MTEAKKRIPPFFHCEWSIPVVSAVQAVERGEATPEQQKLFLSWLVNTAAATYDQSFQLEGDRESSFSAGRRFVGLAIVKLLKLSVNALLKAQK